MESKKTQPKYNQQKPTDYTELKTSTSRTTEAPEEKNQTAVAKKLEPDASEPQQDRL
jgi:hypothetical protein